MTQETLERIKLEKNELEKKIEKLDDFLTSWDRDRLSSANTYLLWKQIDIMREYYQVLLCRIELNEKTIEDEK